MIDASTTLDVGPDGRVQVRVAPKIAPSDGEQAELTRLVCSKRTSVRLSQRARIVLLAAAGMQNRDIAEHLGVGRVQVSRWRERHAQLRLAGIERDLPRGARPSKMDTARLIELTTQRPPERLRTGARARWRPNWA
jgi:FixJ family two-component response regulator